MSNQPPPHDGQLAYPWYWSAKTRLPGTPWLGSDELYAVLNRYNEGGLFSSTSTLNKSIESHFYGLSILSRYIIKPNVLSASLQLMHSRISPSGGFTENPDGVGSLLTTF